MTEPDRIEAHTQVTDHEDGGVALLTRQFRKPAIEAVLRSWLAQVQDLEDAFWALLVNGLDNAVGAQLDQIGDLLGRPRAGLADAVYLKLLRATALAIRSSGTGPELVAILDLLRGSVVTTLTEPPIATVKVSPASHLSFPTELLLEVLVRAKATGVRLLVEDIPSGDAFMFASGAVTETDADHGFSNTGGLVGGQLVGILEG